MPANTNDLDARELIGLKTVIKSCADPTIRGVAGIIRDETKNMLFVETKGRIVTLPKKDTSLLIELAPRQSIVLNGNHLEFRPEDRVKKGLRPWR